MSSEITFSSTLSIRKVDSTDSTKVLVNYNAPSTGGKADMTGNKGPSPGAIVVNPKGSGGTQVSFSQLTRPTFCRISNQGRADGAVVSASDYFEYGMYDPATHYFYPLGEVGPGEAYVLKLSRNIQEGYLGPGSGTGAKVETIRLMLLANLVQLNALVEAFEF